MKVLIKRFVKDNHNYANKVISDCLDDHHSKSGYDLLSIVEDLVLDPVIYEVLGRKSNLSKFTLYRVLNYLTDNPAEDKLDVFIALVISKYDTYKSSTSQEFKGKVILNSNRLVGHIFEEDSIVYYIPADDSSKKFRIDYPSKLLKLIK